MLDHKKCDHIRAVVRAINDKSDGFLDHLLPNTHIKVAVAHVGCVETPSLVPVGMAALFRALPSMTAVVGLPCSDDLQRASEWLRDDGREASGKGGHVFPTGWGFPLGSLGSPHVLRARATWDARAGRRTESS